MIPLFDLKAQYQSIKPEIDDAVSRVMSSGHYIQGEEVEALENEICGYLNVKYAVAVASGTDALILSLRALDIGAGDEVIVPAFSFWATASAVLHVGATPIFVDVEKSDLNINPVRISSKITHRTRAVIAVHLYGNPANMRAIKEICTNQGIYVIEDAAQAFGATVPDMGYAGAIGTVGCFSFFPTKPLGCAGDGGMVVTNIDDIAANVRRLRSHGWTRKYYPEILGYNSRLDAIQAAILGVKLPHVQDWIRRRNYWAEMYKPEFYANHINVIDQPLHWKTSARHLFVLAVKNRDAVATRLKEKGIETGVYYPLPLPLCNPVYNQNYGKTFPVAERASRNVLAIPCYAEMTPDQVDYVAENVVEAVNET